MIVTSNPMGFTCAPNSATPDYIIYHDLRAFVAYGLRACWLGTDGNDPNSDCYMARPVTTGDVQELRGYFLDTMETLITGIWKGDFTPGQGFIEGDYQSLIIGNSDENPDEQETFLSWSVTLQDDAIMLELHDGGDGTAYWLAYDAIEDRDTVLKVMTEARQHTPHDNKVWDKLVEETSK
jgi:hypothetical protein